MAGSHPFQNKEAIELKWLNDTLRYGLSEDRLELGDGPISAAVALASEKLLLSAKHKKRWEIKLNECYPEDREALFALCRAFYKAFNKGRIKKLYLECLDSTNERGRDMLFAVYGMAGANDEHQHNHSNILDLCLHNCTLDRTTMPHLQSFARDLVTVSKLTIICDCFRWPDAPTTAECIAKMFEQSRQKPTDLRFDFVSLFGDMTCLRDWKVQSVAIKGSLCQIGTVTGLSATVSSLKKLEISTYNKIGISWTELGMVALLEDPDCCLEKLILSNNHFEEECAFALFRALRNNHSLKFLCTDLSNIFETDIWRSLFDYLRANPPSLRELYFRTFHLSGSLQGEAFADICNILRSTNHTLEKFYLTNVQDECTEYCTELLPYLARNRAGRRILLVEKFPPGLMAEVLGKIQERDISSFHRWVRGYDKTCALHVDATYHLVREGLSVLFSPRKRKRNEAHEQSSFCVGKS